MSDTDLMGAQQVEMKNDDDWDNIPTMEEAKAEGADLGDSDDWIEEVAESVEASDENSEKSEGADEEESDKDSGADSEVRSEDSSEDAESSEKIVTKEKEDEAEPELIEVKIDGEVEKVSLDDLKSNYSGKVAYDKKFQELDNERKEYKAEVEAIDGYVNKFASIAQKGDTVGAMQYLSEFAGMSPVDVKEGLIKQLTPEILRRMDLDEEQLNFELNKEKVDYEKEKLKSDNEKFSKEQANLALEREILKTQEAYSISREQFNQYYSELDELLEPHENLTVEMVGQYAVEVQLDNRAVSILSEFEDKVEATDEVIGNLVTYLKANESLSDSQVKEVIKSELEALETEEVKEDLNKVAEKKKVKAAKTEKKSDEPQFEPIRNEDGEEIEDFDDL